jgi:hypothetical protein
VPPFQSSWRVFVQPRDNLIGFLASDHHVLSQDPSQHLPNLLQAHTPPLDEADHPPHVLDQGGILGLGQSFGYLGRTRGGFWLSVRDTLIARGRFLGNALAQCRRTAAVLRLTQRRAFARLGLGSVALGVLILLFFPAVLTLVVGDTPLSGLSFAVRDTAPKGATPNFPPGISPVGEEKDAATPAPGQVSSQVGLASQTRSQQDVILQNQSGRLIPSIPLRPELEIFRDPGCKKLKPSLRILMYCKTSSSYRIDNPLSR